MERLACVDLPAFPLQLLLAKHPEWRGLPAAVVAQDKPQAELLWVSPEARASGVLPGMRYAQALSLATTLRAAEVSTPEVCVEVGELADLLRGFSPDVEVSREEPGVFWANADGLSSLFSSLELWARKVHAALAARGRQASVVVGFRRFASYAVARGQGGVLVLPSPEAEEAALRRVPLALLTVEPRLRDTLAKLGIHAVGEFLRLPADAIRRRFGSRAADLHALARGEAPDPLTPVFPVEPVACTILPEVPEGNSLRLLFMVRERLHPLLAQLADRGEALRELEVRFFLDRQGERTDRIRPADATLEAPLVLELLRLRLEGVPLPAAAAEINLTAHGSPATPEQLQLFLMAARRDLAAADRALARIRTELGEEAVVWAKLTEGHLPEARFAWEPLSHIERPCPVPQGKPALVRRLYSRPIPLAPPLCREPDGSLGIDLPAGQGTRSWGPYLLSGAWWRSSADQAIRRRYYFLETPEGDRLWVYYDGRRRRWFLQGKVE